MLITEFSTEILLDILSYVPWMNRIRNCELVSQQWNRVCRLIGETPNFRPKPWDKRPILYIPFTSAIMPVFSESVSNPFIYLSKEPGSTERFLHLSFNNGSIEFCQRKLEDVLRKVPFDCIKIGYSTSSGQTNYFLQHLLSPRMKTFIRERVVEVRGGFSPLMDEFINTLPNLGTINLIGLNVTPTEIYSWIDTNPVAPITNLCALHLRLDDQQKLSCGQIIKILDTFKTCLQHLQLRCHLQHNLPGMERNARHKMVIPSNNGLYLKEESCIDAMIRKCEELAFSQKITFHMFFDFYYWGTYNLLTKYSNLFKPISLLTPDQRNYNMTFKFPNVHLKFFYGKVPNRVASADCRKCN